MLNSIYETLAKKRFQLRSEIDSLLKIRKVKKYKSLWNPLVFKEKKAVIGGVDGSFNFKKYKNFVLYAISAAAYIYDGKIKGIEDSDIGILRPYKNIESRLKLYQSILELKIGIKALEAVDVLLMDGSLLSGLVAVKEYPGNELQFSKSGIASAKLSKRMGNYEEIAKLELSEYLVSVRKLLENGSEKILGVSKFSTWSEFDENLSDMAVFDEVTDKSGFSKPVYRDISMKQSKLVFTTFYARLEDRKDVFMFETPRKIGKNEIIELLCKIKPVCVDGYPYLLRKAHRKVTISDKDVENIFTSLGIKAKTGREVL
jgi:NurA-like 5'-3' nuclease